MTKGNVADKPTYHSGAGGEHKRGARRGCTVRNKRLGWETAKHVLEVEVVRMLPAVVVALVEDDPSVAGNGATKRDRDTLAVANRLKQLA